MRWRLGVWLIVVAGLGVVMGQPASVSAETDGYPYDSKPCVHVPYKTYDTKVNWCPNYDWGDRHDDTSRANVISPYGYYYRNCTDYVAWKVASLGVLPEQYKGLGNAKQWAVPPAKNRLSVDNLPTVGAAAVRTTGVYGHVAFVEAVDPSGSITVSEYNKHADGNFSVRSGMPAALGFTHFVHFEIYMPILAAPPAAVPSVPATAMPDIPELESVPAPEKPDGAVLPSQTDSDTEPLPSGRLEVNQAESVSAGKPQALASPVRPVVPSVPAASQLDDATLVAEGTDTSTRNLQSQQRSSASVEASNSQSPDTPTGLNTFPEEAPEVPLNAASPAGVAVALEQPIAASALPVPHQWWRPSVQSPPSTIANNGQYAEVLAQQYVSPFGYWALGGLVVVTLMREYCPTLGLRYRYR